MQMNLLSLDCNNTRIGSGGYGYTWDLPGAHSMPPACSRKHVGLLERADLLRGLPRHALGVRPSTRHAMARALGADLLRLLRAAGSQDFLLLRKIPNLRKISVSPWNNFDTIISEIRGDYVFSFKPSPAIFVENDWKSGKGARVSQGSPGQGEGTCHVEMIMKDISTVRTDRRDLWDWARIAMEVVQESV